MKDYKVSELSVGDVFWFHEALVMVKDVFSDKVVVKKITAPHDSFAVMSVSVLSPHYEDLKNRVKLASQNEIDKYVKKFNQDTANSRQRFLAGFSK